MEYNEARLNGSATRGYLDLAPDHENFVTSDVRLR
jgi:hypothetical protein